MSSWGMLCWGSFLTFDMQWGVTKSPHVFYKHKPFFAFTYNCKLFIFLKTFNIRVTFVNKLSFINRRDIRPVVALTSYGEWRAAYVDYLPPSRRFSYRESEWGFALYPRGKCYFSWTIEMVAWLQHARTIICDDEWYLHIGEEFFLF